MSKPELADADNSTLLLRERLRRHGGAGAERRGNAIRAAAAAAKIGGQADPSNRAFSP
jgi:hypothetical protein